MLREEYWSADLRFADPKCMHDVGAADGYLRFRHFAYGAGEEAGYG